MESNLNKISIELKKFENESLNIINSLSNSVEKIESIRITYSSYFDFLGDLKQFKFLESQLEKEQIAICDTLIAELGRELVLFDHSLTQSKAALNKFKEQFSKKKLDSAWSFPPNGEFISNQIEEANESLINSMLSYESKRMALFKFHQSDIPYDPKSLNFFIQEWKNSCNI